jgi:hypothetical protein
MTASVMVRSEVKDFDTWKKSFDGGAEFVKSLGVIASNVYRDLENSSVVTVRHQFMDADKARAFADVVNSDAFRKGDPVSKGGVILDTVVVFTMQDIV